MIVEIDAMIFDCDGVLVNSEELAQSVEKAHLEKIGLSYNQEDFVRRFSGTTVEKFRDLIRADYAERFGRELSAEFFDDMARGVFVAYEQGLAPLEGVIDFVTLWNKPKAVASGSTLELVRLKLERIGLSQEFGVNVFTCEQSKPKPHPDVFLTAAEQLGVMPARSAVIEDSVNGVIAAKRAGMFAIGYAGGGHCLTGHQEALYGAGADIVCDSFAEIADRVLGRRW